MKLIVRIWVALALLATPVIAQDEPDRVLLTNVNVWDGMSDGIQSGMNVLIENAVIAQISASSIGSGGATVIDGTGHYLVPGFIDLHTHFGFQNGPPETRDLDAMGHGALAAGDLRTQLESGFTTTRDAGTNVSSLAMLIQQGRLVGPRLFPSGPFLSPTGGHGDFGHRPDSPGDMDYGEKVMVSHIVDGRAEVLKAARSNFRGGATQLKLMVGGGLSSEFDPIHVNEFTLEEMAAAVEIARDYDSYVLVHSYTDVSMNRAMDAGCA